MRPHDRFAEAGVVLRRRPGDDQRKLVVYVAVNTVNGKCYVGATRNEFVLRKTAHIDAALNNKKGSPAFYSALRKYGIENFVWFVLARVTSIKELFKKEIELIAKLKPEYNITIGGQGVLGAPRTLVWRRNQSRGLKGRVGSKAWLGKHHSQETKDKISHAKQGVPNPSARKTLKRTHSLMLELSARKRRKPVICLNDGLHFDSLKFASKYYGFGWSDSQINNRHSTIAKGGRVSGKLFQYAEA